MTMILHAQVRCDRCLDRTEVYLPKMRKASENVRRAMRARGWIRRKRDFEESLGLTPMVEDLCPVCAKLQNS